MIQHRPLFEVLCPSDTLFFSPTTAENQDAVGLHTILLHFWFEGISGNACHKSPVRLDEAVVADVPVLLPLHGLTGITKRAVEGALLNIRRQERDRWKGKVEERIHTSIHTIGQSISNIVL